MIRLTNLRKTFNIGTQNENPSIRNLSLEVKNSEFVTLIGGNGAGKSSLLNLVAGTFFADSGEIYIGGHELTTAPEHQRAAYIGRVFQDPLMGTAAKLTIEENLSLANKRKGGRGLSLAVKGRLKAFFREQLAQLDLGLEDRLGDQIGLLSGGQRQAITLLMATMNSPDVVLLDEHTAALDPKTADLVMRLSQKIITRQKLSAIMITHNMEHAIDFGDRLVVLQRGQIAREFNAQEKKALTPISLTQNFSDLANS